MRNARLLEYRRQTGPRGRVHPRTRAAGGAREIRVICGANDEVDRGRVRSERSERSPSGASSVADTRKALIALPASEEIKNIGRHLDVRYKS